VQAWERLALAAGRVSKARAWYAWGALLAARRALAARVEQLWYERACCGARAALRAWARWRTAHLALERRAADAHNSGVTGEAIRERRTTLTARGRVQTR